MTVTNQIEILNRKIKQNKAQYDLYREAAKISALSSKNLEKYEYLTGEDLGLKPSTVEKSKFEYSPLGISLNKAFNKNEVKSVTKNKSDFNYDSNLHWTYHLIKHLIKMKLKVLLRTRVILIMIVISIGHIT